MSEMIETEAIVIKIDHAFAYVKAERRSNCSGCSESSCGTSVLANFFAQKTPLYRVMNEVGARVGDRVVVGLHEAAMFKGTLMIYLFPLLLLFVGAMVGNSLAISVEVRDGYSAAGAMIGLILGYLVLKWISARMGVNNQFQPIILSRVTAKPIRFVSLEEDLKQ